MNFQAIAGLAGLGVVLFGSVAHADLITNGNFEASTYSSSSQFGTGYGGQGVTGWTGTGGYTLYYTGGTATTVSAASQYTSGLEKLYAGTGFTGSGTTGASFVAFDGDVAVRGGISQMINGLVAGQQYMLEFDWGAGQLQSRAGDTTEQFQVSLGNQTYSTQIVANPSQSFSGWFHQAFTYTATGSSELLSFLSAGTPSGLPPTAVLDGVSLNAVPEPISLSLLGGGALMTLVLGRRRSRKAA